MKKTTIYFSLLFASLGLILSACSMDKKPEDSKAVAEEHNDAKFDSNEQSDAEFLVFAAEVNIEEIKLGKLAQSNSNMKEVRALGEMMEKDHDKALKELQALAAKKQITLPSDLTEKGQASYTKLFDKSGSTFDKEYCEMMVNGHKKAVDKFENASTNATDPDIKSWAASMLPALRRHVDRSLTCQSICEKL